jgi:TonB-linked SusC/RagA family outer membrane protein
MKKNKPIRELLNNSLKKSLCILRTAIALLIFGIMQAYANDTYDENKINFVSDHITANTDKAGIIQQINVTGTVTDSQTGAGMPGVNIVIKGTTFGAITDANGRYSITVPDRNATLVFSFIGYLNQEIPLNGRTNVNVILEAEVTGLEEVVVIGYGTQRKADLTGSITQVTTEELTASPVFNLESSLKGRASGVFVSENDGTPGGGISIRIRGDNSIIGSNEPLYVVDGMPMGGIENLNPSDIASISILKDASSTAIYGSRAANGVVVITTVKGAKGTAGRIEINSYYGMQKELKRYYSLTAKQYAIASNEWLKNEGQEPYFSPSEIEALGEGTDWWAEFIKPAPVQSHTLNFSGGGENTTYSWSINYFDQVGLMINSGAKRGNTRLNLSHQVNNKVKLGLNALLSRRVVRQVPFNNAAWHDGILGSPPTLPVKDEDGNYTRVGTVYSWTLGNIPNMGIYSKPFRDQSIGNSVYANTSIEFKITKELIFESRNGLDYNNGFSEEFAPTSDGGRFYNDEYADGGYASNSSSYSNSFLSENTLSYLKVFNKHKIDVIGGVTYQTSNSRSFGISVNKLATNITENYNLSASSKINNPSSGYSDWAMLSGLARVNYSFDSRYLITASIRADGSSRFGANHKWGYFPSGAVAWNLSNESFMENVDFIYNLKLRASYGITGSTALSPYQSLNRLSSVNVVFGGNANTPGYIPSNVGNPDLKWEKTTQWDLGLDFGILEGALNLNIDYYWKVTSDLLASVPLPSSTGFSSVLKNIGSIQNKGLEVNVSANILRGELKWDIAAQASANRNTILELVGGADIIGETFGHPFEGPLNIMREGEAYGSFYGLVYDGLNDEGYFKYKDINNDTLVNPQDRVIIGDPNAKLLYSINNNFSYKGFGLNIFFEGIQGRDIFWATAGTHLGSMLNGHNQLADFHGNYWTTENPNPNAKYQRISTKAYTDVSTKFVEDGSYLKLKSLTLSYNLPVSEISWVQQVQIYTTGSNLFSLNNYPGLDPDVNTRGNQIFRGVDQNAYPTAKIVTVGCKIVF